MKEILEKEIRYRVNVLHKGVERWKYCRTIQRCKMLQSSAIEKGLSSIIYEKRDGKYLAIS